MCTLIPILFLFVAILVMFTFTVLYKRYEAPLHDEQATPPAQEPLLVQRAKQRTKPADRRNN